VSIHPMMPNTPASARSGRAGTAGSETRRSLQTRRWRHYYIITRRKGALGQGGGLAIHSVTHTRKDRVGVLGRGLLPRAV
jgi:hypothetical protein